MKRPLCTDTSLLLEQLIEGVIASKDITVEKIEKILEMQTTLFNQNQQAAFGKALAAAQAEMPKVIAKNVNKQTSSKYAKLSDVYNVCRPVAAKHGFSFMAIPETGGRDDYLNMKWTLRHDAYAKTGTAEIPLDLKGIKGTATKTATHAFGSTTSYGRRYLFCAAFGIVVGDEDDDGNLGQPGASTEKALTKTQFKTLKKLIDETGTDLNKFIMAYGYEADSIELIDFSSKHYENAVNALKRKKRNMTKEATHGTAD